MAGCLKGALDLQEPDSLNNLQYLSDLLQDASDLSFEADKASHVMVLTTMEFDKGSWQDTLELDRFRRQHTQRHDVPHKDQDNNLREMKCPVITTVVFTVFTVVCKILQIVFK